MALPQRYEEPLMTGEELLRRPGFDPCELIEGRIVPMTPTGYVHGEYELDLASELRAWARATDSGRVMSGEVGIYVRRNPDTVRAADVLYISHERFARRGTAGYLDVPPELVVEILSPDDRWSDVMAKLGDYFEAGILAVWVVDAKLKTIFVYRSLADVTPFGRGQLLADEALLPGFSLRLDDLFR